jgi:hypothetical protein
MWGNLELLPAIVTHSRLTDFACGKEQRVLVLNPFDEIDRQKVAYTVPEILEPA